MDIGDALIDMWRSVLLFVPKALAFLAILLIGYLIARVVRKLVGTLLTRVGFDRAVHRSGIGRKLANSRYDAADILAQLAYYAILLFALQFAFGVWGPNPISDLISAVVAWLPKAFIAIIIVVVAAAIASAVRDLINGALGGLSYGRLIATVVWVFIVGLGVIAALNQVGIATTVTQPVLVAVLATVAGILIVGVGGGLIRPMQGRWEHWLERISSESAVIRERARAYQAEKAQRVESAARQEAEAAAAREAAANREAAEETAAREAAERARVETAREEAARRSEAIDTAVISREAEQTQVIPRPEEMHIVPGMRPADEPTPATGMPVAGSQPPEIAPDPAAPDPAAPEAEPGRGKPSAALEPDPSAEQTQVIRQREE
jgi:hypothetical protein